MHSETAGQGEKHATRRTDVRVSIEIASRGPNTSEWRTGQHPSATGLEQPYGDTRMICQLEAGLPGLPLLLIVVPLISQIKTSPVVLLRHRISALPSPLKSPAP